ncbi:MAG: hypothetical protein ACJ8J7_14790 [Sulfurifustaceae bacterium]
MATLAVGAPGEGGNATGIGGDSSNNDAPGAGAVYAYSNIDGTAARARRGHGVTFVPRIAGVSRRCIYPV